MRLQKSEAFGRIVVRLVTREQCSRWQTPLAYLCRAAPWAGDWQKPAEARRAQGDVWSSGGLHGRAVARRLHLFSRPPVALSRYCVYAADSYVIWNVGCERSLGTSISASRAFNKMYFFLSLDLDSSHWFTSQPLERATLESLLTRILAVKEVRTEASKRQPSAPTGGDSLQWDGLALLYTRFVAWPREPASRWVAVDKKTFCHRQYPGLIGCHAGVIRSPWSCVHQFGCEKSRFWQKSACVHQAESDRLFFHFPCWCQCNVTKKVFIIIIGYSFGFFLSCPR